jgi:uncharacterized protein YdiU (UPF0061 family)
LGAPPARSLGQLRFDNRYARLPEQFYDRVDPTPLRSPRLLAVSGDAAALLGLGPDPDREELAAVCGGGRLLPSFEPLAMVYAGHQFGYYVSRLGDGRAILLGQVRDPSLRSWDLHLKGAGKTLYSRGADGRAVLRSTVREFLCGEAMAGLGIPTTRALCIVASDEPVQREQLEHGAALLRITPSHVRFGSFEYFFYQGRFGDVRTLADYVLEEHFAEFAGEDDRYGLMLDEVVRRTARLIARWQAVGFAHGVLNTDNMSILGETLDYGPFGFMDAYRAGFVPNHSDEAGRYAFDRQPGIGLWNLSALGRTFAVLIGEERANRALALYEPEFIAAWYAAMRAKFGLAREHDDDDQLVGEFFDLLAESRADHTLAFRALGDCRLDGDDPERALLELGLDPEAYAVWEQRYRERLLLERRSAEERRAAMRSVNPKYVLRNHLAQKAIEAAQNGDPAEIERLLSVLRRPYDDHPHDRRYAAAPPAWAASIEVSCSS